MRYWNVKSNTGRALKLLSNTAARFESAKVNGQIKTIL